MQLLNILFIILEVLVLFNLLIIVHELGHFLAAKWRGLHVERFGIWFGKPIWERSFGGVKYSLGSIPAGGFVALPQMAPMEALEGESETHYADLPKVSVIDKIIVAFAGPLFSFGLAIFFAGIVWIIGRPVSESETTTIIGYVLPDSPAEEAGLLAGDRIVEIDGGEVNRWSGIGDDAVAWRIISSVDETLSIKVEREGEIKELVAKPVVSETKFWERSSLRKIGIRPFKTPIVEKIHPNSPADQAGILEKDRIQAINGKRIYHPITLIQHIKDHPDVEFTLDIHREALPMQLQLLPTIPVYPENSKAEKQAMIGADFDFSGEMQLIFPKPWKQVEDSVMAMVNTLKSLFAEKSDIGAQHLSGPVGIMRIYFLLFEKDFGWRLALWFSVLLNVNLAILNLLPIPVLDGGHIVMAIIEGIFRKPIPFFILNTIQSACALLLIGYILYVTFFDVQELPWKREKPQKYYFVPIAKDKAP